MQHLLTIAEHGETVRSSALPATAKLLGLRRNPRSKSCSLRSKTYLVLGRYAERAGAEQDAVSRHDPLHRLTASTLSEGGTSMAEYRRRRCIVSPQVVLAPGPVVRPRSCREGYVKRFKGPLDREHYVGLAYVRGGRVDGTFGQDEADLPPEIRKKRWPHGSAYVVSRGRATRFAKTAFGHRAFALSLPAANGSAFAVGASLARA
jgi:hypothetical protein